MKFKKIFKALTCILSFVSLFTLASCGESNENPIETKLVIGMECNYQPFNWTEKGQNEFTLPIFGTDEHADGYDIQVAKYLSEATGMDVEIHKLEWGALVPALQNEEINMVLAGMSVTDERLEQIDFTDPYLSSDLAFLIQKQYIPEGNSSENPSTYEELLELFDGKTLICQQTVVGDGIIETYFKNNEAGKNIQHAEAATNYPLAAQDVLSGNAFAMPAELPVIEAMVNLDASKLGILHVDETFLGTDDLRGLDVNIGIKKGNTKLKEKLNAALSELDSETRSTMMGEACERSAGNAQAEGGFSVDKIFSIISNNAKMIGYGILSTLILAIFGTGVGLLLGIFLAYGKNVKIKQTDNGVIKTLKGACLGFCNIYSSVLRGTPMMVQALIFKYGCSAIGLNWNDLTPEGEMSSLFNGWLIAGLIVITFNTATYMGEIVRSGLNGVDRGQFEGARSLGMSASRTSWSIILPQAIRNALPTIGNELIVNIKDSSVLNVIMVTELYYRLNTIAGREYAFLECYIILAMIYLVLTLLASGGLKLIEKKLDRVKISLNPFRCNRRKAL